VLAVEHHLFHRLFALSLEVDANAQGSETRLQVSELEIRPGQLLGQVV
jgi:hypothetical protein